MYNAIPLSTGPVFHANNIAGTHGHMNCFVQSLRRPGLPEQKRFILGLWLL